MKLSNGETGEIVFIHREELTRPIVKITNGTFISLSEQRDIYIEEILHD
ncbi:hypothetical protein [Anoxybacteroides amylolyticum]|uniref:Metal dependent phosphohydrolase domain protein n=1 Tax=Anoxybacteroides amylolyticum TaxID=294699 RepID=A0A160F636_9BACL|nr:hypothetical protein [Anoxybacillus amylolyticus]ANB62028.1 metal dependent phosphohydrolase domain protein [Anoxybacillus amylolyticus]